MPDEASPALSLPLAVDSSPASPLDIKRLSSAETETVLLGISHLELGLLDHYYNFVAPNISAHDHLRRMWQHEITHQAKSHSFLMHNILSISAYHLCCAYTGPSQDQQKRSHDFSSVTGKPKFPPSTFRDIVPGYTEWQTVQSKRYEHFALEQQRLAFQTYIPNLHAMTSENQEAVCAASALLSLGALASTQNRYQCPGFQTQLSSPIDDWLEISVLVRGVDAVVKNAGVSILDGSLQPLLRHRRVEPLSDDLQSGVEDQVKQLVSSRTLSALDGLAPAIDRCKSTAADKEAFHSALTLLRASFAIVVVNPEHESLVMVWSNLLDASFFPLVKRREPMALVLLAYWTVLFGTFRDRWWVGGLNITILKHVAELLIPLDESDEGVSNDYEQIRDREDSQNPLESYQYAAMDPRAGKLRWRDLLEWPLRENGIQIL